MRAVRESYNGPLAAKFAREDKPDPTNWLIVPSRRGRGCDLISIQPKEKPDGAKLRQA